MTDNSIIHVWTPIPMSDEEYEAHPYAAILEMDKALCPDCGSPLMNGVCLNACHLSTKHYKRFMSHMREVQKP